MVVLLGLAMAAAVLYAWLAGNWFGRVLAAFVFVPLGGLGLSVLSAQFEFGNAGRAIAYLALAAGAVGGWFLTALPMRHWQRRARTLARS